MQGESNTPSASAPAADFLPGHNSEYLKKEYWDARFEEEEEYEWCKSYDDFKHLTAGHMKPSDEVLVVGSGNSGLTEALHRDGHPHVTSMDISPVAVARLQAKLAGLEGLNWCVADMLAMPFPDASFDVVIEKGTLDVLLVDDPSPWAPRPDVAARVAAALGHIHRVLRPGGVFLSITFAQPHFRKALLLGSPQYDWDVQIDTFGEDFKYYVYALRRGRRDRAAATAATATANGQAGAATAAATADLVLQSLGYDPERYREGEGGHPNHDHMDQEDYLGCIEI